VPSSNAERAARTLERLRRDLSRSREGLALQQRRDGATEMQLGGRFQSATVVVKDASGRRQRMCIDHPDAIDAMMGAKP
jgi:hypothetical protein